MVVGYHDSTVMYGSMTDKANHREIISELEKNRNNREFREKVLDSLGDSTVDDLTMGRTGNAYLG